MAHSINALVLEGARAATVRPLDHDALPKAPVHISVLYSSLNYKDALAVTGQGKVIRAPFPFVPGIDLVGRVKSSKVPSFDRGDLVVQTGGGLGETTWGGYSQHQHVDARYLVRLPSGMTPLRSMTIGTAGVTAMMAIMALEEHGLEPQSGEVVVTGASGGVGGIAVALLARLGYAVVASSGSEDAYPYLRRLGATRIIGRLIHDSARPLVSAQWSAAIDAVGGAPLAALLGAMRRHGSVAACGNAAGDVLSTTIFPFILRGVNLLGIDSNTATLPRRREAWRRLGEVFTDAAANAILSGIIGLDQISDTCARLMAGQTRGRYVVDVNA